MKENGVMQQLLETPYLQLDTGIMDRNLTEMQKAADVRSVALRPHLKTAKSVEIAKRALVLGARGITVSTLLEAEYFADHGITDITYAVGMTPDKLDRAAKLQARGVDLKIMTDNAVVAQAIADHARAAGSRLKTLIELDCGAGRAGVRADDPVLMEIAGILQGAGELFQGVLTHAGQSYAQQTMDGVRTVAEAEADAGRTAAANLEAASIPCKVVSIGSTPTALADVPLDGVTELRAGVYMFFDIDQYSRDVCGWDQLALSVVATVIGHNHAAGKILLDAGGLALSQDRSADRFLDNAGYGLVCAFEDGAPVNGLSVNAVSQEHGHVLVKDSADFDRLPIASKVRIYPIHACMTAAAYGEYHLTGGETGTWSRINGW